MQVLKVQNLYHVYRLRDVDKPNLLDYSQSRSFLDMERVLIICAILAFKFIQAEPTGDILWFGSQLYFGTSRQSRDVEEFVTVITIFIFLWAWACLQKVGKSVSLFHSHFLSLGLRDGLSLFQIHSAQVLVSATITQKRAKEIVCLDNVWRLLPIVQIVEHGEWKIERQKMWLIKKENENIHVH